MKTGGMDVTNDDAYGRRDDDDPRVSLAGTNGVVYVKNRTRARRQRSRRWRPSTPSPTAARNRTSAARTARVVTLAGRDEIMVRRAGTKPTGADLIRQSGWADAVLGLDREQLRARRPQVDRTEGSCTTLDTTFTYGAMIVDDVKIDAAILSLQHSFMVDN